MRLVAVISAWRMAVVTSTSTTIALSTSTIVGRVGEEGEPTIAPVQRAAGSAGEMNFGVTGVAAPKAASSNTSVCWDWILPRVASMPQMQEPDGHYEDTLYNGR